tara:strand:+ start:2338 stop:2637 length:300 start_codon:yes stop_codon:yes gene_type:complete
MAIRQRPVRTGRVSSIGTAAAQLTSSVVKAKRGVQITADSDNAATIYVGNSNVTADAADTTDGYPIAAGETVVIPTRKPSDLYLIAESGDAGKVWWLII